MAVLRNISILLLSIMFFCTIHAEEIVTESNVRVDGKEIGSTKNFESKRPAWAHAVVRTLPNWEIIQCDEKPSVRVGEYDGYRLVLRRGRKEYINTNQQRPSIPNTSNKSEFVMKYSHIDLVLLKNEKTLSEKIIERIPWLDVEQEYFTKPVYMGTGQGFMWFVNTTLFFQEYLRKELGLEDGDDRIQLLVEGLFIMDKGTCTPHSVDHYLADFGDKAIPYIKKNIKKSDKDPWYAVLALSSIPSEQSTELLKLYYNSGETRLKDAAAYALIHKPFRIAAKKEYLDILAKQKYIDQIGQACLEFNWKEALPIFENICSNPNRWRNYYNAFIYKRCLEGQPVPDEIVKAQDTIRNYAWSSEKIDTQVLTSAKQIILNFSDKEAAAVIAFNLVVFNTKTTWDKLKYINEIGWDILRKLPVQDKRKLIKTLINLLDTENGRNMQLLHKDMKKKLLSLLNPDTSTMSR
jgi:hypothetical protein